MDKKPTEKASSLQANRILYLVIIGVLCVSAIIIGITAALRRPSEPSLPNVGDSSSDSATESESEEAPQTSAIPTLTAPLAGNVTKKHDLSVLVHSVTMGDWRVHAGLDIAAKLGDEVKATAAGTIKEVWEDPLMGTCVSIEHGGKLVSVYKNLHETLASGIIPGVKVNAGDTIGAVGETALIECAENPHIHFEVMLNGEPVDPLDHISASSQEAMLTFDEDVEYEG